MSWQEQHLYKLLLLNRRGTLLSAPFKTKPSRFAKWGKKRKHVGNNQSKPWIWFGASPRTQVSISKCISQARRGSHGAGVFCVARSLHGISVPLGCAPPRDGPAVGRLLPSVLPLCGDAKHSLSPQFGVCLVMG